MKKIIGLCLIVAGSGILLSKGFVILLCSIVITVGWVLFRQKDAEIIEKLGINTELKSTGASLRSFLQKL